MRSHKHSMSMTTKKTILIIIDFSIFFFLLIPTIHWHNMNNQKKSIMSKYRTYEYIYIIGIVQCPHASTNMRPFALRDKLNNAKPTVKAIIIVLVCLWSTPVATYANRRESQILCCHPIRAFNASEIKCYL